MKMTFQHAHITMSIVGLLLAAAHAQAGCGDPVEYSTGTVVVPFLTQSTNATTTMREMDSNKDNPQNTKRAQGNSQLILGLWHVAYVLSDGTPFYQSFKFWHPDGTEWESANASPLSGNVCLGVWKGTDTGSIRLHHVGWRYLDGNLTGSITLDEINTVAPGGKTYRGTFVFTIYDLNGNFVQQFKGALAARRITVDDTSLE